MKLQLSIRDTGMGRSIRFLLFGTFLVLVCITVSGTSWLQAHEGYSDAIHVSFPNHAQARHAKNVAISVARKDPEVRRAFWRARETGDPQDFAHAKALLARKAKGINREIVNMRDSGSGWGEIAAYYRVHPGVIGLGHSKTEDHHGSMALIQKRRPMEIPEAKTRGFNGDWEMRNGNGLVVGQRGRNGHGNANGKGHGGGNGHGKGKK